MRLKSCEYCGVVLDLDQLRSTIKNNALKADIDGIIDSSHCSWSPERECFTVLITCPVCSAGFDTGEKV